jgi:hypothetical protein
MAAGNDLDRVKARWEGAAKPPWRPCGLFSYGSDPAPMPNMLSGAGPGDGEEVRSLQAGAPDERSVHPGHGHKLCGIVRLY